MSFAPGTYRTLMLTAAWVFGAFLVVAAVFRGADASQDTLAVVAGVFAYAFLAAAAVILVRGRLHRGRGVAPAATRFLAGHPALSAALGEPVVVGDPEGEVPAGSGAAQANLIVPVSGPRAVGRADLVMARVARDWEVLSATLLVDGDRVSLAGGHEAGDAGDGLR